MDERFTSLDSTSADPKRRFWSLGARRKLADGADAHAHGSEELARRSVDTANSWRSRKSMKSSNSRGDRKERKKSRLSIWKSWFLTLLKSKSKSSIERSCSEGCRSPGPQGLLEPDLFGLSCVPSLSACTSHLSNTEAIEKQWRDAKIDHLGMAITLPEGVSGRDVRINIELKAIPMGHKPNLSHTPPRGITFLESTPLGPLYTGHVDVPSNVTLLQVSEMPLYFLNGEIIMSERRVETIIKPVGDILPEKFDPDLVVDAINLRIHFETKGAFNAAHLEYEFLTDVIPIVVHEDTSIAPIQHSQISFNVDESLMSLRTEEFIDQITDEAEPFYDESSKMLVKGILNEVVSKLSLKTSMDFIKDFHKELEEQKSLLLETSFSILPDKESLLSKISETEQEDGLTSKSSSKVSSRSSSRTLGMLKSSDTTLYATTTTTLKTTSGSSSRCHLAVPANTPNDFIASVKHKRLSQKQAIKEDVKADIDMTLKLLETAKNKLLRYLNHDYDQVKRREGLDQGIKIKVAPFKDLDEADFFHEVPPAQEDAMVSVPEVKEVIEVPNNAKEPDVQEEQDTLDDVSDSEHRPKTHPVNELKQMLLSEMKKQPGFPEQLGQEEFDLEYLAYGNVFLNNDVIEEMTDSYLNDDQIDLLAEYQVFSLNTDVFEQRYLPEEADDSESAKAAAAERAKTAPPTIDDDINIMLHELIEHSDAIKACACAKEKGDARNEVVADVQHVLDQLIQRVEEQVTMGRHQRLPPATNAQVYQVNQVYFCLIDDYVDVFPTAGRAGDGNAHPLAWLTSRLRSYGVRERQSTISVRRILANGPHNGRRAANVSVELHGLLDKLEKGSEYLTELYKEIYSRPLNVLQFGRHLGGNPFSMADALPLVRKSKKILTFAKKEGASGKETVEEQLKKIINPDKERAVQANSMQQQGRDFDRDHLAMDLTKWPSWKRKWIQLFTRQHANDETEGLQQLTDLVKLRDTFPKINHGKSLSDIITSSPSLRINKCFHIPKGHQLNFMNTPSDDEDVSLELAPDVGKKVSFARSDKDIPRRKVTERKNFKVIGAPPITASDTALPGTSTTDDNDLFLLHAEDVQRRQMESQAQIVTFAEDEVGKIKRPVADVPRGFATSSMEQVYMKNIDVLQRKLDGSTTTLRSTSSSDISSISPKVVTKRAPDQQQPVGPSQPIGSISAMLTPANDMSKTNLLPYSSSVSEISSRSSTSPANTTDYYADLDAFPVIMPELRPVYISQPELNRPEEVAIIEDNILKNDRLNPIVRSLSGRPTSSILRLYSSEILSTETSTSLNTPTDVDVNERL